MSASTDPDFKSVIENVFLRVCCVTPTPQIVTAHQNILDKNYYALYPYIRSDIKRFTVSRGAFDFTMDDIFQNMIPSRLIIGMISNEALSGSYKKNPFNFRHFYVTKVEVCVDGESVPGRAIQTKFGKNAEDGNYIGAYMSLVNGSADGDNIHSITREDYAEGYTFFKFDLEPEIHPEKKSEEDDFWPSNKKGNLRVDMRLIKH